LTLGARLENVEPWYWVSTTSIAALEVEHAEQRATESIDDESQVSEAFYIRQWYASQPAGR
jgi:hypothetical protein